MECAIPDVRVDVSLYSFVRNFWSWPRSSTVRRFYRCLNRVFPPFKNLTAGRRLITSALPGREYQSALIEFETIYFGDVRTK